MTPIQAEIILALAEHNMRVATVARAMMIHRNNIEYHVRVITKNTGKNPLNFYDLHELVPMAEEVLRRE